MINCYPKKSYAFTDFNENRSQTDIEQRKGNYSRYDNNKNFCHREDCIFDSIQSFYITQVISEKVKRAFS